MQLPAQPPAGSSITPAPVTAVAGAPEPTLVPTSTEQDGLLARISPEILELLGADSYAEYYQHPETQASVEDLVSTPGNWPTTAR